MTKRRRITAISMLRQGGAASKESFEEQGAEILASELVQEHSRKKSQARGVGRSKPHRGDGLLSEAELVDLESRHAEGMTAVQIVEVFVSRGVRFSEATFRKYVQQGLVPRSRRVGRKGKHRGSLGVYPAKAVRRINLIKELMADGYTIEEIQSQFLQFADVVERLDEGVAEAFELFEADLESPRFEKKARKSIEKELVEAKKVADELLERMNNLSQRLSQSHEDEFRSTGAAGSAEDLL